MLNNIFSRVGSSAMRAFGAVKEPLRKLGQIGYNVGKYAVRHHDTLTPLLHGLAMASGNESAQKVSGGLLALSKTATMLQNKSTANKNIESEINRGGYGVYNHATGKMSNYPSRG
jgi:hypothetical protein